MNGQTFSYRQNYKVQIVRKIEEKHISLFIGILVFFGFFGLLYRLTLYNLVFPPTVSQIKTPSIPMNKSLDTYQVKEGDTLWKIAEEKYGSGFNAYDIMKVNQVSNPDLLKKGQSLILPKVSPKEATQGDISSLSTAQVLYTGKTYTVKEGDYLTEIALKVYGDGNMAYKLIQANNLTNPEVLEPGKVLKIPR